MTLLQELIKETVTTANAVNAGGGHDTGPGGSLFKGGIIKRKRTLNDAYRLDPATVKVPRTNWGWRILGEMADTVGSLSGQGEESTFDPADVMSKLKKAEKQVDAEDDTITFGMEDEDGNVVKVYVRKEQADEFETALAGMLAGEQEDDEYEYEEEEEGSSGTEIAEVLFKLKDKFDIVDVEWPEIEGDVEEEQELGGGEMGGAEGGGEMGAEGGAEGGAGGEGEMGAEGGEGEMGAEGGEGDELDLEGGDDLEGGEEGGEGEGDELDLEGGEEEGDMEAEGGAESALQQVIDMMKADAEARKAESEAKAKEAEARAAEAHAQAAAAKVSQEEQVLDAEAHEEQKKAEKDETERLAKMAKYRHAQAAGAEASMAAAEDEEEISRLRRVRDFNLDRSENPISVRALADEIISRLRGATR